MNISLRFAIAVILTGILFSFCHPSIVMAQEPGGDSDQDGIPDSEDNCPQVANPIQLNSGDGDGLGDACDPDDDGDEIEDSKDNCPTISNPDQQDADGDKAGDACDAAPVISPRTVIPCIGTIMLIGVAGWFLIRRQRRSSESTDANSVADI